MQGRWLLALGALMLLLDQLTKTWAEHVLGHYQVIDLLPVLDFSSRS